ncbi:MAG: hypothetical protein IJD51_00465 [Clostridia bacterium]|nr:hypothetical protein [Clostridia bacterium]
MFFEWLADNIFSVLILLGVIAVLAILAFRMYREHKASAHSPTPRCCGCPYAKRCSSGSSSCSCHPEKEGGEGEETKNP